VICSLRMHPLVDADPQNYQNLRTDSDIDKLQSRLHTAMDCGCGSSVTLWTEVIKFYDLHTSSAAHTPECKRRCQPTSCLGGHPVLPVPRFSHPIGRFFRLIGRAIFGGCGLHFFGRFRTCRGYCATAVLGGNQWSVDTANELIIARTLQTTDDRQMELRRQISACNIDHVVTFTYKIQIY